MSGTNCVPRIDKGETAAFEAAGVPGNHACVVRSRRGRDHEIERRDRPTGAFAHGEDVSTSRGGVAIERQDAPLEVILEHGAHRDLKVAPAAPVRQYLNAGQDLGLADCRGKQRLLWLAGDPNRQFWH